MADTAARVAIIARRYEVARFTITVAGIDLTGADMKMQVRLQRCTLGPPSIQLNTVTTTAAEGLKLDSVTVTNGVPTSIIRGRINASTMNDTSKVPFAGELGSDFLMAYAMQWTLNGDAQTRLLGDFIVQDSAYGSDGAPTDRPVGYMTSLYAGGASSGTLQFGDQVVHVTIDGAEQVTAQAAIARTQAERSATNAGAAESAARRSARSEAGAAAALGRVVDTAANAQAALLTASSLYPTTAAGLASVAEGGYFAVAQPGDVAAAWYRRSGGAAVLVNRIPGASALNHLACYVPANPNVDNAIAINAALADPAVGGVVLPPGDIRIDSRIDVPSGKFMTGAGKNVTRLVRTDNATVAADASFIRTLPNSYGVRLSDFTLVCPINNHSFNGVHMMTSFDFRVERVAVYNASYSFWAQEHSARGVFDQCDSHNGNVDYETTQAYDILFENGVRDDDDLGMGANPAGNEAWWHCLLASRSITFRNMRGVGRGQPFLVVANDVNDDPLGGLITDIRYEQCRAVMTSEIYGLYVTKYNGSVGRVVLNDCDLSGPVTNGLIYGLVENGGVEIKGGRWRNGSQEGFIVTAGNKLVLRGVDVSIDTPADVSGQFVSAVDADAKVLGCILSTTSRSIGIASGATYVDASTRFSSPNLTTTPPLGRRLRFVLPANAQAKFAETIVSGGQSLAVALETGKTYSIMFKGRMQAAAGAQKQAYVTLASTGGTVIQGSIRLQTSATTFADRPYGVAGAGYGGAAAAYTGDYADFELSMVVVGNGNAISFMGLNEMTILAGAELSIERLI